MPVFKPVDPSQPPAPREAAVLAFWNERHIFEASLERPAPRGPFVFYEGPPTANGKPHVGHVLTRVVKDLFPRYKTMCGYRVDRKGGWDTHGLPVEIEVEKEIGISGKGQIEAYGVEPFVRRCMDSVFRYTKEWESLTERIGFWLDQEGAYVTYHASYVESVWWSLKQLFDRGLLFRGHKIVPWCPRCGTALSSHEVGLGYEEVDDPSAFVLFPTKADPSTLLLAWTTTPWTLLSNAALAVKADVDYVWVKVDGRTLVLADALLHTVLGKGPHDVVRRAPGASLVGTEYEPIYRFATFTQKAHYVVAADFVGLDAGSGIVHVAPAFGADDYKVGLEHGLPVIQLVDTKGEFTPEVEPWKGRFCKSADKEILRELKGRGLLFKQETYRHDYPHCWRCHGPLIYFARDSWFIRTTQEIASIIAANRAIVWQPEHIKEGRFGKFLESNVDWALSRERYWGTPLPIWACEPCGTYEAFASRHEILARNPAAFAHFTALSEKDPTLSPHLEVHKPYVDAVVVPCGRCGGPMRRVPEVIDCWYDSGSMPFAQWGYPHVAGSAERFRAAFPADFISEAIDQTRGWFYALLAVSVLVFPDGPVPRPYRRCIVLGHVGDDKGKKLSKHLRNYGSTGDLLDRQGADAVRWFFYSAGNPWTNSRFSEANVEEAKRDFLGRLWNVYSFFVIYANIDGWDPADPSHLPDLKGMNGLAQLDRWILSELQFSVKGTRAALDAYDVYGAAGALFDFVDGLSNWYVRRSRDRFWRNAAPTDPDKRAAFGTLYTCLATLARLLAPFTPFFAEELYQNLCRGRDPRLPDSVHLDDFPEVNEAWMDGALRARMALAREVVSLGRAARTDAKLKVRQPLREAVVVLSHPDRAAELADLWDVVRDELNVKAVRLAPAATEYVKVALKLNFPRLGPRLGPKVKALQSELGKQDAAALRAALQESGEVRINVAGEAVTLSGEDLKVEISSQEGFAARSSPEVVVVLDAHVDEPLRVECRARELISLVNGWRGDLALPYEARIRVRGTAGPEIREALERHRQAILAETLSEEMTLEPAEGAGPPAEGALRGEVEGSAVVAVVTRAS